MPQSRHYTLHVKVLAISFVFLFLLHGGRTKKLKKHGFKITKHKVDQVSTTPEALDLDPSTFDNKTSSFVFTFPTVNSSVSVGRIGQYEEEEPFAPSQNFNSRVWDSEPYHHHHEYHNNDAGQKATHFPPAHNNNDGMRQKGDNGPQEFNRYEDESHHDKSLLESDNTVHSSYPLQSTKQYYYQSNQKLSYDDMERQRAALIVRALLLQAAEANQLNNQNTLHTLGSAWSANSLSSSEEVDPLQTAPSRNGWGWAKKTKKKKHKHGWGWKGKGYSELDIGALGLLGLLGVLSLLSNVLFLLATTTTTTAAGRKKRFVEDQENTLESKRDRIFYQVLENLSPLAHARNGLIPVECTYQGVCKTNKILVQELGLAGRVASNRVTSAIVKLMGKDETSGLAKAGLQGRNARSCESIYPVCKSLVQKKRLAVPFSIRMEQLPLLFNELQKMSKFYYPYKF